MERRNFLKSCFGIMPLLFWLEPECNRCGKCCLHHTIPNNMWSEYSMLTKDQKKQLLKTRSKYPKNKTGCDMVIFEKNGLSSCLIHKMYGYDAKPVHCKEYPKKGRLCLYYTERI